MFVGLTSRKSAPGTHANQNVPIEAVLELELIKSSEYSKLEPSAFDVKVALALITSAATTGFPNDTVATAIASNTIFFIDVSCDRKGALVSKDESLRLPSTE